MAFKVIMLNFPFSDALVSNKSASERSVRVAIPTLRLEHVVAKAIRQDKYLKATSFEWLMNQCTGLGLRLLVLEDVSTPEGVVCVLWMAESKVT